MIILAASVADAIIRIALERNTNIFHCLKNRGVEGYRMVYAYTIDEIYQQIQPDLFDQSEEKKIIIVSEKIDVSQLETLSIDHHILVLLQEQYKISDIPKAWSKQMLKPIKYDAAIAKKQLGEIIEKPSLIQLLLALQDYHAQANALEVIQEIDAPEEYLQMIQPESQTPIFWLSLSEKDRYNSAQKWFDRINNDEVQLFISILFTKAQKISNPQLRSRLLQGLARADAEIKSGAKISPATLIKLCLYQNFILP